MKTSEKLLQLFDKLTPSFKHENSNVTDKLMQDFTTSIDEVSAMERELESINIGAFDH